MADNNTLNYSSFDFETIKADMITNMKANGIFRDYNFEGSNIRQLIELFAGLGDLLNFYVNMVADESFLRTADIYENINKIVELIGYNPPGPKSSEITISVSAEFYSSKTDNYFTINNLPITINNVEQPIRTLTALNVSEDGLPIKYTPISSTTFVAVSGTNTFNADINLVQGEYQQIFFSGTGLQFQKFVIDDLDGIEEYIIVRVGGVEWVKVANIYTHGANEKIYSTRYGKDKKIEIQFGNGLFGEMPYPGANNIEVWYIRSMNLKGAIGPNQLTSFDSSIFLIDNENSSNDGSALTFTITQTDSSIGHNVPLSEDEIRELAPKQFRTQDRLMSTSDHEDLILTELGNYVSQVLTLNQDDYYEFAIEQLVPETSGFGYNNVYMYVLPKYGYEVNQTLKSRILEFVDSHKLITLNYTFRDLNYKYIDISISYKKDPDSLKTITQIETDIYNILKDYFSKTNMKIGGSIKYSTILKNLTNVDGTSSVILDLSANGGYSDSSLTSPVSGQGWLHGNIYFNKIEFPILNTSGLIISYSGDEN